MVPDLFATEATAKVSGDILLKNVKPGIGPSGNLWIVGRW